MIRRAVEDDKEKIIALWKMCFPNENVMYTNYYFDSVYNRDYCIVYELDGEIVGLVQRLPHKMLLHSRYITTSMIVGLCVHPDYRNTSIIREMLDMVMDLCQHSELVTLVQSYDYDLYQDYGFSVAYHRQFFDLTRDNVRSLSVAGISYKGNAYDMLRLYATFMAHFDGYYVREEKDFNRLIQEIEAQDGKIIYYYDQGNRLKGYATILMDNDACYIDEIVYLDSITLIKLLSYALNLRPTIHLAVSNYENIAHLLNDAPSHIEDFSMIRVNDFDLYNRLYNSHIKHSSEVIKRNRKPMNMIEFM